MPHVRGPGGKQDSQLNRAGSTIDRHAPAAKPRDDLEGSFAGDKNDPKNGTHIKSRKLDEHDRGSGKIPKG